MRCQVIHDVTTLSDSLPGFAAGKKAAVSNNFSLEPVLKFLRIQGCRHTVVMQIKKGRTAVDVLSLMWKFDVKTVGHCQSDSFTHWKIFLFFWKVSLEEWYWSASSICIKRFNCRPCSDGPEPPVTAAWVWGHDGKLFRNVSLHQFNLFLFYVFLFHLLKQFKALYL